MKGTNCPLGRFLKGQFQLQCGIGVMARPGSNPDFGRVPRGGVGYFSFWWEQGSG